MDPRDWTREMDPRDAVERQDDRRAHEARGSVPCAMIVEVVARFGRCGMAAAGGGCCGEKDATGGILVALFGGRSAEASVAIVVPGVGGVTFDAMMSGNGGLAW